MARGAEEVAALLMSDARLVLIEAPGGCGKTYQGAAFAAREAVRLERGRVLILAHTHAACAAFSNATRNAGSRVDIRTIDSLTVQIATVYQQSLGLPADPMVWVRKQQDGYAALTALVSRLLREHGFIARALATRFPVVVADEHQDASADQHAIVMALADAGAKVSIFGDPMQSIFQKSASDRSQFFARWNALKSVACFGELDYPYRWDSGSPSLGQWVMAARTILKEGRAIDLTGTLPEGLTVVFAENEAQGHSGYRISQADRRKLDMLVDRHDRLLVLTPTNPLATALSAFWGRRVAIWEGHTRDALGVLVDELEMHRGDAVAIADAAVRFVQETAVGFGNSTHGDRLRKEVSEGCTRKTRGLPAHLQQLARFIVENPDHRGVAAMLVHLQQLKNDRIDGFSAFVIDYKQEFREAVRLGEFDEVHEGFAELTRRRTFQRPMPPARAISTIHKAKGLECEHVLLLPCDSRLTGTEYSRCRLYVALSRASTSLTVVLSRSDPSPLFRI